jgi:hypothetical protein
MSGLARLQAECDDNAGAGAARAAAEALTAAAEDVRALAGEGGSLLAHALIQFNDAILTAERLYERQISAVLMQEAGYVSGYAAGLAARGLRPVR